MNVKQLTRNNWFINGQNGERALVKKTSVGYSVWFDANRRKPSGPVMIDNETVVLENLPYTPSVEISMTVHGYSAHCPAYNQMYDVKHRLPLYTQTKKSKCVHAAGYYLIEENSRFQVEFCPRLVTLHRQRYSGPYQTESQAHEANKHNTHRNIF